MSAHTPTPWAADANPKRTRVRVVAANGAPVATIECASANTLEAKDAAAFIVRACNGWVNLDALRARIAELEGAK